VGKAWNSCKHRLVPSVHCLDRPVLPTERIAHSVSSVRKREPVQRIATWPKMRLRFPRNTRSPVNQCPEHVKKQSLYGVLGTAALSLFHGRSVDPRERPNHPGVPFSRPKRRVGRTDAMSEASDWECESALAAGEMLRDLSTSRSHKPERARAVLLSALRKIRYVMTSSSQGA
jgi:hypothetical protein